MTIKIAFNNVKGGCGKTMTVFQVAAFLSDRGYKVLCLDFDPQGNLTRAFLNGRPKIGLYEFLCGEVKFKDILKQPYPNSEKLKNIHLLPTTYDLFFFKEDKESSFTPFDLKNKMKNYDKDYDFVFIDTNPSISLTTLNALIYSDFIFGVLDASLDSIDGFQYLNQEIAHSIKEQISPNLKVIGILLNENDRRKKLTNEIYNVMKDTYGDLLFSTFISNAVKTEESRVMALPIIEYDPRGIATDQYAQLTTELISRLKKEVDF